MQEFFETNTKIKMSQVEQRSAEIPEHFGSTHDLLGKEYDFNGVSFTVLGMEPDFFDGNEAAEDLQPGTVAIVTIQKQSIPVIPFSGGMARITKIQIGNEIIAGSEAIHKRIVIVDYAREGWMTNGGLAQELGISNKTIKNWVESFRQSHPEWFRDYKSSVGSMREHWSPWLCDVIRSKVNSIEQVPDGWMTRTGLTRELFIHETTIDSYAKLHQKSHPEWFRNFKIASGNVCEHFAPELCNNIRSEVAKYEYVPFGWMTKRALARELNIEGSTVNTVSDAYRQSHPEWFCKYKTQTGQVREHYSLELCTIVRSEIKKIEYSVDGWMMRTKLAKELRVNTDTIALCANVYRQSNPQWFHNYKIPTGQKHEYFAPELCDLIRHAVRDKRS